MKRWIKQKGVYESMITNIPVRSRKSQLLKMLIAFIISILSLLTLGVLIVFLAGPITFMQSIAIQRFFMFINVNSPSRPNFNNASQYGLKDVLNFPVTVKDMNTESNLSLGTWYLSHENQLLSSRTLEGALQNNIHPIVIIFHGVACNRIKTAKNYLHLRKYFSIVVFDYRDFGDSSSATLSEEAVVNDAVQLYKWIKNLSRTDIYVWGHSLGTALSTHTVKKLKEHNIVPKGLVLESPFTTMREEFGVNPLGKVFAWLPYFQSTMLDPLYYNGFHFNTSFNILNVDCPIMILHAEDDTVVPCNLGKKLYEIARSQRKPFQGTVTYHQFAADLGYGHLDIIQDPNIPHYVENFIKTCNNYYNNSITV